MAMVRAPAVTYDKPCVGYEVLSHLELGEGPLHVGNLVDPHRLPPPREARHPVRVHALAEVVRRLRLLQNGVDAFPPPPLLHVKSQQVNHSR
jgi:hypothetical protein